MNLLKLSGAESSEEGRERKGSSLRGGKGGREERGGEKKEGGRGVVWGGREGKGRELEGRRKEGGGERGGSLLASILVWFDHYLLWDLL